MRIVNAVSGVPVRLTAERLLHIETQHPEMMGQSDRILETVAAPDMVQEGDFGVLIAVRHYPRTPLTEKYCAVVYRETSRADGFVMTAYFTRRPAPDRRIAWKR